MEYNQQILLDDYYNEFVKSIVSSGRYSNANEVIKAGLRLLENEENKSIALKNAIAEGIDSGIVEDFDGIEHLKFLKANK